MERLKRGFTLVELLVVVAILAIMMAITVVGIDPVDKVNSATDSKVVRDVTTLGAAMEAYAVYNNNGVYTSNQSDLVAAGHLKVALYPPPGYGATYVFSGGGTGKVGGILKSKKYTQATPSTPAWVWCSEVGRAGPAASTNDCPSP